MIPNEKKDKSKIEALRDRLYRQKNTAKREWKGVLHEQEFDVPHEWVSEPAEEEIVPHPSMSFARKFFAAAFIIFIGTLFFVWYQFSTKSNVVSSDNIDIVATGPSFVGGGERFSVDISIANRNPAAVELAEIVISYPKGQSATGEEDMVRIKKSLGDISPGTAKHESVDASVFGAEGSDRSFSMLLSYKVPGSNAIFTKETNYSVTIKSSPISLSLDTLKEISSGQELMLTVKANADRGEITAPFAAYMEYPTGFQFIEASPKPDYGNDTWNMGTFKKDEEKTITIRGVMKGEDGDERTFRVSGGSKGGHSGRGLDVVYTDALSTITIKKPFVDVSVYVNGSKSDNVAVQAGSPINVELRFANNLQRSLNNMELTARLDGVLLDKTTVEANGGYYDSKSGIITWNKSTNREFTEVLPGASGRVAFTFRSFQLFKTGEGLYRDPHVTVIVGSKGNRFSEAGVPENVTSQTSTDIKFNSDIGVSAHANHFDGVISNIGPIPPVPEQETTYTIALSVSNSSNRLANGEVTIKLPQYVTWKKNTAPVSEKIDYSNLDNEVVWHLGTVEPGVGILGAPRVVYFQVGIIPSVSQEGREVSLTGSIDFVARDTYTGRDMKTSLQPVTTRTTDIGIRTGDELVSKRK